MTCRAQSETADVLKRGQSVGGGTRRWIPLLALTAMIWGFSFTAVKHVVQHVTPLELVTLRFVPAGLTFAALLLPTRGRQVWEMIRAEGWRLFLMGLTGAVLYNTFLGWGETRVAAGTASLIIALNPTFIYVLSVAFLGENVAWHRVLGLAVAFGGLFVIIRWGSGRRVALDDVGYALITMLAPLNWAIYTVLGKSLVARHPPLLVTGIAMMFAGLVSLLFVLPQVFQPASLGEGTSSLAEVGAFAGPSLLSRFGTLPWSFWGAVLYLALPCTVLGFAIWFGALEHMPAGRVASFVYLVPLFAVTFGGLLLGEPVTSALILGAAILVGGVWLVNRR